MNSPKIVSRAEWLEARKALLAREKELTRLRDELAAERRTLPWVRVEKQYVFDGPHGKLTLADLFDGRSQLFVKHFMMGPGQVSQCVGCSLEVDQVEGALVHLHNRDVSYVVVARAPIGEIETVRKRMGWNVRWVSSYHSEFNYDFHVSFTPEQIAAGRAFYNYGYVDPGLEDLRRQRVHQGRRRPDLSLLFDLRTGWRRIPQRLPISRRDAEGAGRGRTLQDAGRLGAPEEHLRQGRPRRSQRALP